MDSKTITKAAIDACEPHTRYELAKRLGTKWENVNRWVKGEREPRAKYLLKMLEMAQKGGRAIALLLGVSMLVLTATPKEATAAKSLKNHAESLRIMLNRIRTTIRAAITFPFNTLVRFPLVKL